MFNFKNTAKNINTNDTRAGITSYKYSDYHHWNIITENLRIIENKKLIKVIRKGPNHREPRTINSKTSKNSNLEG